MAIIKNEFAHIIKLRTDQFYIFDMTPLNGLTYREIFARALD